MLGILAWIILGLIAGLIAKAIPMLPSGGRKYHLGYKGVCTLANLRGLSSQPKTEKFRISRFTRARNGKISTFGVWVRAFPKRDFPSLH